MNYFCRDTILQIINVFYFFAHKMPQTKTKKQVLSGFWHKTLNFFEVLIFVNFDLKGNVTDCVCPHVLTLLKSLNAS